MIRVPRAAWLATPSFHRSFLLVWSGLLAAAVAGCSDGPAAGVGGGGAAGASVGQAGTNAAAGSSASGGGGAGSAGTANVAGAAGSSGSGGTASSAGAAGMATGGTGGGAGGTGGTSGGSGVGGGSSGSGGGASGACTHKLCEDFESGATGALPDGWTKLKGYGADAATDVGLARDAFHSGKSALKSSSMAPGQTRAQRSLSMLGATASKHWGRIFYKVPPATKPTSGVLHVTFVGLMGNSENRVVDTVQNTDGKHQWLYNNPDDNGSLRSAYDWSFDDAWHCAEWFVDVGAKSYKFFSDSKEVPSIGFTGKGDAQMSEYKSIIVGAEFYQMPPAPFVMWFDDLAIDDTQVGCQ